MKRLSNDLWTDGKHTYKGNPRDGFVRVVEGEPVVVEDRPVYDQDDSTIEPTGEQ